MFSHLAIYVKLHCHKDITCMMAYSYGKLKSYICLDLFTFLHENVTMDCKCWAALWTYLRGLALKIISGYDTPPTLSLQFK